MASKRFIARFGLDNSGNSITNIGVTGSTLTQSGAFSLNLTTTAATTATFPSGTITLVDLASTQTLTNKTLTTPSINGASLSGTFAGDHTKSGQVSFTNATAPIITAKLGPSSTQQHSLPTVASDTIVLVAATQALTGKTVNGLTISTTTGTLSLANGSTLATSGANSITLTSTAATNVTLPTTGTLATLAGTETLTNKTISNGTISGGSISGASGSFTTLSASGNFAVNTNKFTVDSATGNVSIAGDLTVSGTTTTVNSTTLTVNDPVVALSNNSTATADSLSRGVAYKYGNGTTTKTGFFGVVSTGGAPAFTYIPDATETTGNTFSGTAGALNISSTNLFSVTGGTGSSTVTGNTETLSIVGSGAVSTTVSKSGATTTVTISAAAQQNTYSNISDGTTTASAGSITDTIKFRATGTGLSVTVGSNDATHGDNVLYTVSSTANADATTLVARDAAGESAFRGIKLNTASATTAAHLDATTATFAAAGAQTIASYSGATYKAAKVIIRAGQGANFQVTELLVVNDGAATPAVNHVEYGFVDVGTPFSVTYNATGAAGNTVNITADAGATSTTYSVEMVELV